MAEAAPNKDPDKMKDKNNGTSSNSTNENSGNRQPCEEDACCAAIGGLSLTNSEETSAKSLDQAYVLESSQFSFNSTTESDATHMTANCLSALGIDSRTGINLSEVSGPSTSDISLNSVHPERSGNAKVGMAFFSPMQNHNNIVINLPYFLDHKTHQVFREEKTRKKYSEPALLHLDHKMHPDFPPTLGGKKVRLMVRKIRNIPPDEPRVNNTDVQVAIAEHQCSFRSTPSVIDSLTPIHYVQPVPESSAHDAITRMTPRDASYCFDDSMKDFSSMEDNVNISVNNSCATTTTAKDDSSPLQVSTSDQGAKSAPPMGPSSSFISVRTEIPNNCPVRKLPRKIIRLVASHLQIKQSQGTWKELVELHDWNYQRTFLFEHQAHDEGIFYSLLREPEFQDYTLDNLRQDLHSLPRIDVLHDLNEMILEHNENAQNTKRGNPTR